MLKYTRDFSRQKMASTRIAGFKPEDKNLGDKLHLLPCEIKYSGDANVAEYFEKCVRENDANSMGHSDIKLASFRGRPLKGKEIALPNDYKGLVLREEKKPVTDDKERTLVPKLMFTEINHWNLDTIPSDNDNISKALQWINISKALHSQYDEANEPPQNTQTDR